MRTRHTSSNRTKHANMFLSYLTNHRTPPMEITGEDNQWVGGCYGGRWCDFTPSEVFQEIPDARKMDDPSNPSKKFTPICDKETFNRCVRYAFLGKEEGKWIIQQMWGGGGMFRDEEASDEENDE